MTDSIAELNQINHEEFVNALGSVFEQTPSIAYQVWYKRPFANVTDLHQQMLNVTNTMSQAEQLALIQAHPDLGSKVEMAEASVQEQSGVGLDQLTLAEFDRFQQLNQSYQAKFGFPFIIAVKNHTKASILEVFDRRLHNSSDVEIRQALAEIAQITWFRLLNLVEHLPSRSS
jgi:2-oxo-4-hydroxy-4-carboxy-5-ureidoimidazoline decarboxylase